MPSDITPGQAGAEADRGTGNASALAEPLWRSSRATLRRHVAALQAERDDLQTRAKKAEAERDEARAERKVKEKIAPVQGYSAGIPWSLHLRAYDVYCKKYSPQPALIDLEGRGCRGGFDTEELDMFIPGWREEVSEIAKLRSALTAAQSELATLRSRTAVDAETVALSEAATPGLWEDDYTIVDDSSGRYNAQQAIDALDRSLFDTINSDVALILHDYDGEGLGLSWDEQGARDVKFAVHAVNFLRTQIAAQTSGDRG